MTTGVCHRKGQEISQKIPPGHVNISLLFSLTKITLFQTKTCQQKKNQSKQMEIYFL